jgi:hypothetical protein
MQHFTGRQSSSVVQYLPAEDVQNVWSLVSYLTEELYRTSGLLYFVMFNSRVLQDTIPLVLLYIIAEFCRRPGLLYFVFIAAEMCRTTELLNYRMSHS